MHIDTLSMYSSTQKKAQFSGGEGKMGQFLPRMRCPEDPRVTFSVTDDGLQHDFFTWQPPKGTMGISSFAAKFQAKPRTFWTKNGLLGGTEFLDGCGYTLWWTYKKLLKMAIDIVDFPIKHGDFPWQNVSSPEGSSFRTSSLAMKIW